MSVYQTKNIPFTRWTGINKLFLGTILFSLLSISNSFAQQISVSAENKPLNEIAYDLIDRYNLQLSFNDRQLSRIFITVHRDFRSPDEALNTLLAETSFTVKKVNEMYLFVKKSPEKIFLKGWIGDIYTLEALPFAHVVVDGHGLITDNHGNFSLETGPDKHDVSISYLGYYLVDTILNTGFHKLLLVPSVHDLNEITIEGHTIEYAMETGESPGTVRLNQKIARKLPGNGDNAVFNFLRLQPGILAAGEQSRDLIIWGGYEGHSKVMFDGYTIYGLKNYNDNISAVNPYMAKDILVLKGGYGAEYGGRVGGIVDITGISGDKKNPSINLNINNMTLNGMASVPVLDNAALVIAFRRTYYNLYESEDLVVSSRPNTRNSQTDFTIIPDYTFGDFNLKFSGASDKRGNYYLSYYEGRDHFRYDIDQERDSVTVQQQVNESNHQRAGAMHWDKSLGYRVHTDITMSYTDYSSEYSMDQDVSGTTVDNVLFSRSGASSNYLSETGLWNNYTISAGERFTHTLKTGIGVERNHILLQTSENDSSRINSDNSTTRFSFYATDIIGAGSGIRLKPGIRVDYQGNINKVFIQPRFTITMNPIPNANFYFAWGLYNQFISKASQIDDFGNYQYFWAIADEDEIPVLTSEHYVFGGSYRNSKLTLSAEAYYKSTAGLTRFVNLIREHEVTLSEGDGVSVGADFLAKGRMGKHEAWISYSYGKTIEYFSYFPDDYYRYAPQDQRHEIKTSVLLNFNPLHFSADYVYGSGFEMRNIFTGPVPQDRFPYSRFDIALSWALSMKNYTFELGASILNLFNTENIKYSNFVRVPMDQPGTINIHAEAVPFTPTIFLNMAF